ncbi:MAG: FkbM family methyltransferase [Bacteroidetes bacterium]|nr:FkbM family methyltransferase [Bacteroidota bacterium]
MKNNAFINFLRLVKRKLYAAKAGARKLLHINYTRLTITDDRYKFLVPDDLFKHFREGDYYEHNVVHFLDKIVKSYDKPVMIDVGASCGYYSVRYSKLCRHIFSFEPAAETYKFLEKNIKINAIENVTALKIGLSDSDEEKKINLYSLSANNTIFDKNIAAGGTLKKIGVETIKLKRLDDLVSGGDVPAPDIIKVDIEGAELSFLKGAKNTVIQYRPTVLLEYSDVTTRDAGYDRKILLNTLDLINYNIYGIAENTEDFSLIKLEDFGRHDVANVIFIPAERDSYL